MNLVQSQMVPALRFPNFLDEYSEVSIGEVFSIFNGYAFSSVDSVSDGARWIKIADVGIQRLSNDNKSFLPKSFIHSYCRFVLCEGDYIVALTRPILNGRLKIAKVTSEAAGSLLNQRVGKIVTNHDQGFIYSLLQKQDLINKMANRIAGTDPPNLSASEINSIKVTIPSDEKEQQKIASFLTAVDDKLNLLRCKRDGIKTYKHGVMQQLFSQATRFKDNDSNHFPDWKVKKLGDICNIIKGKGISKSEIVEDGSTPCIRYGELYTKYSEVIKCIYSRTNVPTNELVLSESNDVIIPASGETHIDIATASCVLNTGVALGGDLNIIRSQLNGIFLAYYLNNARKHDIASVAQGSSVIHLYPRQLEALTLTFPSLEEQNKIANFLIAIDQKIERISSQIIEIQTFKRGLLQQMFV